MKQTHKLCGEWFLRQAAGKDLEAGRLSRAVTAEEKSPENGWYRSEEALSVHEILLDHGVLDEKVRVGECLSCRWVAESDWIYVKNFEAPALPEGAEALLTFMGLDTVVDIYLNGEYLCSHADMFLPLSVDVTGLLRRENTLALYFHSPVQAVARLGEEMPEAWKGHIEPHKLLRKTQHDFVHYLGARPYLTAVGIFADVLLTVADRARIVYSDIDTDLSEDLDRATVSVRTHLSAWAEDLYARVELFGPDGRQIAAQTRNAAQGKDGGYCEFSLDVEAPELWWPRPYGGQPLYRVSVTLTASGRVLDTEEKNIGLRKIEMDEDFHVTVNKRLIKLWGANFVPVQGLSHRWDAQRGLTTLQLARECHMNCLRIWGEGVPYGDELYDEADRQGILIWQEFYTGYGFWPDDEAFRAQCAAEAEYLVKRLKHRPAVFMWCGNNEAYMFGQYEEAENRRLGYKLFMEDFAGVCQRLDPGRYYHPSSAMGGAYPNDPLGGDTHGYHGIFFEAGMKYPVFFSENARTSPLPLRSLLRFMTREEIWPEGYVNTTYHGEKSRMYDEFPGAFRNEFAEKFWKYLPVPPTWSRYTTAYMESDASGIEKYYDAHDVDSVLYRFTAAAADYYKDTIETMRRGRPYGDPSGQRRCQGHLVWKLNDTWPQISFTLVDFFLEPCVTYYAVRRAYRPILVSIELDDHIAVWGVNDTADDFNGKLEVKVFSCFKNRVIHERLMNVSVEAGESSVLMNLDGLGPIRRECVIYARLTGVDRKTDVCSHQFLDIEREMTFPDAKLTLEVREGDLIVTTDKYAHFVELIGSEDGDEFGWYFEDNYFELFPFEEKRIKISGKHSHGVIRAKAHFSSQQASVSYSR